MAKFNLDRNVRSVFNFNSLSCLVTFYFLFLLLAPSIPQDLRDVQRKSNLSEEKHEISASIYCAGSENINSATKNKKLVLVYPVLGVKI